MKTLAASLCLTLATALSLTAQDVWFGTTTSKDGSKGIYHGTFDAEKGKLSKVTLAAEAGGPGFLTLHPKLDVLYACAATPDGPGVVVFAIQKGGMLEPMGSQQIGDGGAAHLSVHPSGKMLITAQYGGGSTAVFPLDAEGNVGERSQLIKHGKGSGVVKGRQDTAHAHWTGFDAAGRFAFVPDLGLDGVVIYKVTGDGTGLEKHGFGASEAGGGARHMKFSPDEKLIYVLNELTLSVTSFSYDAEAGTMEAIATVPTLSEDAKAGEGFNSASEIRVHPSGNFVYSANRGHDSITAFRADGKGGLTVLEVEPIRGAWPRNFSLDNTGRWLLAAGGRSSTVAIFEIDQKTGLLKFQQGSIVNVPTSICVLFGRD